MQPMASDILLRQSTRGRPFLQNFAFPFGQYLGTDGLSCFQELSGSKYRPASICCGHARCKAPRNMRSTCGCCLMRLTNDRQYFATDLCLNVPSNLTWDPTFKTSGNEPLGLQLPPQGGGCLSLALDLKAARLKHRHSSSAHRAAGALTWAHSSSRAFLQSPWGMSGGLEQSCVGFSNLQFPWTRSTAQGDE